MQRETKQSLVLSFIIHGGIIGFAVLFLILEAWLDRPEPVVFELISPAAASPAIQEQPSETVEEAPIDPLDIPDPEPIQEAPIIPELPKPVVEPPPPKPKPKPPEPEPVKKVSASDFFKNRDRPDRIQKVEQKRKEPVVAPKIETNLRKQLEKQLSDIQLRGADIGQVDSSDALMRYLAELRSRVQSTFNPSGSALKAEVYFTVTASGRILDPRIHNSSGVLAFDESVIRAMQVARSPGPPPGNREYEFSLIFRSE